MTTKKTQRELILEYWGRVHDMCDSYNKQHGTNIRPQRCVKYCGNIWGYIINHPVFDGSNYDLAVAIIEDMPVFLGDKIYHKEHRNCVAIIDSAFYDPRYWTLTPPKPKRTFELNGQQLPCPETAPCGFTLGLLGHNFYYKEYKDINEVERAIFDMLVNARDKD
ncbi:MAG: hypothetical protein WC107_04785 [Patescibacteria group bacterium]